MRVLLSTYGSRGDVEPLVGLAARLREFGAQVRVCAPPDFADRLAEVDVEVVGVGPSARELTRSSPPPSSLPARAAAVIADQLETLGAEAHGCDVLVATGMLPAAAGALAVAELRGIPSVSVTFQQLTVPSPHHRPLAYPGRPYPADETDLRVLWDLEARNIEALFGEALNGNRTSVGLPPVEGVRDHVVGPRPWVATDPVLDPLLERPDLDVVQTGAWLAPDGRALPAVVTEFLEAGAPPVYVGFGSMPMGTSPHAARTVVEAVRAQGRRIVVGRGWADLAPVDGEDGCLVVGEVDHRSLFGRVAAVVHHGGAGTTTAAARAGTPQVVVPQLADQPYWAARVTDLGIGVAHGGPTPTVASLSAALEKALAPETRVRATAVAPTVRTDGATVAATMLLDGAAGTRRPVSA